MNSATQGFLLSLSLCLDIGIVNVAIMTLTIQRGYWNGFWLGIGSCIGDLIYAILALAGMTMLLRFPIVRWAIWIIGTALLIILVIRILISAYRSRFSQPKSILIDSKNYAQQVRKGMLLALSSPSAIIWFTAVGGVLIAEAGGQNWLSTTSFLVGFFIAGLCWTLILCAIAHHGSKTLDSSALTTCYLISALLLVFLTYQVALSGYQTLILGISEPILQKSV